MESSNLKTPPDDFDPSRDPQSNAQLDGKSDDLADVHLDAFLRKPLAELRDDGFSARVLTALPPRSRVKTQWSPTTLCTVTALLASLAALAATALWGDWTTTWQPVLDNFTPLKGTLSDTNVLVGLVVAAGSVIYAWRFVPRGGQA